MTNQNVALWRRERLGLSLIAVSLMAIAVTGWLLFEHLRDTRESRIRAQGLSLARVLSGMPIAELLPSANPSSVLRALQVSDTDGDFAYAVVLDAYCMYRGGLGVSILIRSVSSSASHSLAR